MVDGLDEAEDPVLAAYYVVLAPGALCEDVGGQAGGEEGGSLFDSGVQVLECGVVGGCDVSAEGEEVD